MAGDTSGNKTRVREFEEQLVKAARMYAMCQKAGVAEPLDVTGISAELRPSGTWRTSGPP